MEYGIRIGEMMEKREKRKPNPVIVLLFVCYLGFLLYLLFFSENYGRTTQEQEYRYNLELFKEIRRFWENREKIGVAGVITNLLGNIAAFAPFGFFLPMLFRPAENALVCTLLTALFSLLVETAQLLSKVGAFDVDDIFLNAVGGFVGYLFFYLLFGRRSRSARQ